VWKLQKGVFGMMTFFSKILVPYDESELAERALKTSVKLGMQDKKIELHIVYVLTLLPLMDYADTGKEQVKTLRKQNAEHMLAAINESLQGMGNPVSVCLLEGAPEKRIIEYVEQFDIDLIVIGSRGLSGLKELFLGSISHYVAQHSPVPTLIVK
jgi:nucleotide-binding universal stress UspA family protein